jgi:hypothetical protein
MAEHFGVVLVPNNPHPFEAGPSATHIVAQRQRDGWQLVSSGVDQYVVLRSWCLGVRHDSGHEISPTILSSLS